ncbi:MAG TPA: hypothetical protein VJU18_08435 [Vicinamibacteria bacterium]|nr:hypothetical protein [Vicinamibacteria bacterium]
MPSGLYPVFARAAVGRTWRLTNLPEASLEGQDGQLEAAIRYL